MYSDVFPIVWSDFHFLRPTFLWGLIPVVLLLIIGLVGLRDDTKWKKIISPHLRPYMIKGGTLRAKLLMQLFQFLALGIGITALAGPTWKKVELPGKTLESPLVILLDLSQSMMATDIQPSRLERAKFKIQDFLEADPGARIALIGFAGTAHTVVPLSEDYRIIKTHIENLSPKVMPFRGSDLERALAKADTLLSVTKAPGRVLLLSDDFSKSDFALIQSFTEEPGRSLDILPVNTRTGSEVPAYTGKGSLRDAGEPVYSALNEDLLTKINSLDRVAVHQLTLDNSDVKLIAKITAGNLEFTEKPKEKDDDWRDFGVLFLIPAAVLILFWFRKGWVLYSFSAILLLGSCQNQESKKTFKDLWYTKDYQGQLLSDEGDFQRAAETYDEPLRKGVAFFKSGDYDDAILEFSRDTGSLAAYNLGLAYYKNGDYASAMMAFGEAASMDPEMQEAVDGFSQLQQALKGTSEADLDEARESTEKGSAQNEQNKSPEDLSGGGQEATKKDMEKQRLEETVSTDIRKGKESDEVPEDFQSGSEKSNQKVLMRKLDDDPARFLMKKFEYEVKRKKLTPDSDEKPW